MYFTSYSPIETDAPILEESITLQQKRTKSITISSFTIDYTSQKKITKMGKDKTV